MFMSYSNHVVFAIYFSSPQFPLFPLFILLSLSSVVNPKQPYKEISGREPSYSVSGKGSSLTIPSKRYLFF
ncbi:hypothetical protein VN97_g10273 [Penicillium thymicola]|uniref:Uncharacterized protein n=1 Tax=Penicillium thymicola TaxID=293382 RepID=A0AAI9TA01_PENTH|nr:hypothetical protein VN97_g10273 [Penicillium thymicola]